MSYINLAHIQKKKKKKKATSKQERTKVSICLDSPVSALPGRVLFTASHLCMMALILFRIRMPITTTSSIHPTMDTGIPTVMFPAFLWPGLTSPATFPLLSGGTTSGDLQEGLWGAEGLRLSFFFKKVVVCGQSCQLWLRPSQLTTSSNKTEIVWIETELSFFFFLPRVYAPHVYVRAWVLGCFRSLISTQTPNSGLRHTVNHCLRHTSFRRQVPESGVRSVIIPEPFGGRWRWPRCGQLRGDKECPFSAITKIIRQSLEEGAAKRCLEEGAGKRCSESGASPFNSKSTRLCRYYII